jgi:hypothetical protein
MTDKPFAAWGAKFPAGIQRFDDRRGELFNPARGLFNNCGKGDYSAGCPAGTCGDTIKLPGKGL